MADEFAPKEADDSAIATAVVVPPAAGDGSADGALPGAASGPAVPAPDKPASLPSSGVTAAGSSPAGAAGQTEIASTRSEPSPSLGRRPATSSRDDRWQRLNLPFIYLLIGGLAAFFVVTTYIHLDRIDSNINSFHGIPMDFMGPRLTAAARLDRESEGADPVPYWQVLTILEANAMERRYHQANMILASRIWIRYMGFLTGMILSLVGSGFIISRYREDQVDMRGEGSPAAGTTIKGSIVLSSPGIFCILAGTVLIIIAMLSNPAVVVNDRPIFIRAGESGLMQSGEAPQPSVAQ